MRWGWYSLSNMNGDNNFLSFVSINSKSNTQGEREHTFRRKALISPSDGWKNRSTFLLYKYSALCIW